MPYWLFLKKRQNLKLSSAANYRWRFKGLVNLFVEVFSRIETGMAEKGQIGSTCVCMGLYLSLWFILVIECIWLIFISYIHVSTTI